MGEKKNEIILFENQGVKLEVNLKEELHGIPTVAKFATVQKEGDRNVTRNIEYYNLDMIEKYKNK